jgi:hypothetical protein
MAAAGNRNTLMRTGYPKARLSATAEKARELKVLEKSTKHYKTPADSYGTGRFLSDERDATYLGRRFDSGTL